MKLRRKSQALPFLVARCKLLQTHTTKPAVRPPWRVANFPLATGGTWPETEGRDV